MERSRRLSLELRPDEIFSVGYDEFIVCRDYGERLLAGGMGLVNGAPGSLSIVDEWENAMQLHWRWHGVPQAEPVPLRVVR